MKPRFLIAAAAVALASHSTDVRAQAFLSDPRVTNGMGVKAGDFELHPGLAGEFGYDSNYFQRSGTGNETVIGAYTLHVTPSLSFQTTGRRLGEEGGGPPPTINFRGRLSATYAALFASDSTYSSQVSKQSNNVAAGVGLGADILPGKPWGGDIEAGFGRVIQASNDPDTANAFRRDNVNGGVGIDWRPGGGLFKWRLGYGIAANLFEDSGFRNLDNVQHSALTSGMWLFLPRTAFVYQGELTWLNYGNGGNDRHGGEIVRSLIGLNGLFTNYFGFLALGGWGASFFDNRGNVPAQNFDSFIGQAEVTFYPTPQPKLPSEGISTAGVPVGLSSIALGYNRNFSISYLGDYYQRDRGYANFTYFLAQRFVLILSGGLSHITRPPAYDVNGARIYGGGGENRADATAFFEYRPGDSLGINLSFRYDAELTKGIVIAGDDLSFSRYQAFLGLRWFL
jgi:hypothetical protein